MVLVGILGIVLVALFVLVGKDARRASATGPRWKRKLLATGLMLLTAAGIVGCNREAEDTPSRTSVVQDAALDSLLKDPRWLEFRKAWSRAEDIALGRIKAMPIYSDNKAVALKALARAGTNLNSLAKSDLITDAEHEYLKCELSILIASLKETPVYSALIRKMTTYEAVLAKMRVRATLLKTLAKCKVVPGPAWKILRKVLIRDLKAIEDELEWEREEDETAIDPDKLCREIHQHIETIDMRATSKDIRIEKEWSVFEEAYSRIRRIPEGPAMDLQPDPSAYMGDAFRSAQSNLDALKSSKFMPEPMHALLNGELSILRSVFSGYIGEARKTDFPHMEDTVIGDALARTKLRQGALSELAGSRFLRPRVIDNALAMAEADFNVMVNPDMSLPNSTEYFLKGLSI